MILVFTKDRSMTVQDRAQIPKILIQLQLRRAIKNNKAKRGQLSRKLRSSQPQSLSGNHGAGRLSEHFQTKYLYQLRKIATKNHLPINLKKSYTVRMKIISSGYLESIPKVTLPGSFQKFAKISIPPKKELSAVYLYTILYPSINSLPIPQNVGFPNSKTFGTARTPTASKTTLICLSFYSWGISVSIQ